MKSSLTPPPDGTTPMHIVLSETERRQVLSMINNLTRFTKGDTTDLLADRIAAQLAALPGADSAELIRPIVKCLPPAVATDLPTILAAEGAAPRTALICCICKDLMFRIETAVLHGRAFLALTDLECENTHQLRGY